MRNAFNDIPDSITSIEQQVNVLALESNIISNMAQGFAQLSDKLVTNIRNSNAMLLGFIDINKDKSESLGRVNDKAVAALKTLDFLNYGSRLINTPENFKGNLLDYAVELESIIKSLYKANNETLAEYNMLLSAFITNKDSRQSLKDHSSFYKRIRSERESFIRRLDAFSEHNGSNRIPLNKVISRMADIPELIKASVEVSKLQNRDVIVNLNTAVKQSVDLLDMVSTQIKEGTITELPPTAAVSISHGAFEVAKLVELVSIVYYDVEVLLTVVNAIAKDLAGE